jgi:hypothetical protein
MAKSAPHPGAPLANASKRLSLAQRDQAKARGELEYQRRLEQIAEEQAKGEIAKLKAQKVERAWPQERPAPRPSPVPELPIGAPGITGARYHLIEREWCSEPLKPALRSPRTSYTGYGTKRRA